MEYNVIAFKKFSNWMVVLKIFIGLLPLFLIQLEMSRLEYHLGQFFAGALFFLAFIFFIMMIVLIILKEKANLDMKTKESHFWPGTILSGKATYTQIAIPKSIPGIFSFSNNLLKLQTPEYTDTTSINKVKLISTNKHPSGKFGLTFWNRTFFPAFRLIEFVSGDTEEIKKVYNYFLKNYPNIKFRDYASLLR
jgi:hypothetical protein